jgi:hypothetical protein
MQVEPGKFRNFNTLKEKIALCAASYSTEPSTSIGCCDLNFVHFFWTAIGHDLGKKKRPRRETVGVGALRGICGWPKRMEGGLAEIADRELAKSPATEPRSYVQEARVDGGSARDLEAAQAPTATTSVAWLRRRLDWP